MDFNIIGSMEHHLEKIADNKTDVIFYDSDLATIELKGLTYILTVAGEYEFTYKMKNYNNENFHKVIDELTDDKIKEINSNGDMNKWGWFSIEIWENNSLIYTLDNYPITYDEAIDTYIKFTANVFKYMEKLDDALIKAEDVFWASIANSFPEAESGDIDPIVLQGYKNTNKATVKHWLFNNIKN